VVVRDFNVLGIAVLPSETDPVLLVDSNAMLPPTVAAQLLEPIAGGHSQLTEIPNPVELSQLASARVRPQERELEARDQPVIVPMGAYPEPQHRIAIFDAHRSVSDADSD
jgi:hypothetical protein